MKGIRQIIEDIKYSQSIIRTMEDWEIYYRGFESVIMMKKYEESNHPI